MLELFKILIAMVIGNVLRFLILNAITKRRPPGGGLHDGTYSEDGNEGDSGGESGSADWDFGDSGD
jgi:hypothetical protein